MSCQLRTPDEIDPLPTDSTASRMDKLRSLVCGGPFGNRDDLCLFYWKDDAWVAWSDSVQDPLPEANVTIA